MTILSTLNSVVDDVLQANAVPIYRLSVDGIDISSKINNRLVQMRIENKRGFETDTLDLTLSDHDGLLEIPSKGAVIQAWIGWQLTGLVYKGSFVVKEVEHAGAPDVLRIRATSGDMKKSLKKKKERSFDDITLGDLIRKIAIEHDLNDQVSEELANHKIIHIDQNESDANLLTRLADEHDAIATIKNGMLLFMPKGKSQTISGQELPTFVLTRSKGDEHRYSFSDGGEEVTAIRAFYYDDKMAKKLEVIVGDQSHQNIKELRHIHRDKQTATLAARAKLNHFKRTAETLSYRLARGVPDLIPEQTFLFIGVKEQIDEIFWLGTTITDTLNDRGYTTDLQLEVFFPDADDVSELFEDQFVSERNKKWTGVVVYYQEGEKAVKLTKGDQSNPKHFSYLYLTKAGAQQRLDREYALLDLETGKFTAHNELDQKAYTGLKTQYTIGQNKSPRYWVTLGDQTNPKVIDRVFQSKVAAEKRLKRELPRLNAKKDMLEQVKTDQKL
ncbi:contractile injection system protein, VgrG/Pvc8 family [Acinetobacter nosocomialis]|uniref:contractile injection system protein, VgrG/Pvc8 family n=2 Tax=Acinetobacter nosocomialis TaxID=106654 RepID=UPI003AF6108E